MFRIDLYFRSMISRYLLLLFLSVGSVSSAQDCSRVWLKGRVSDTLNKTSFYNLMVINTSTGQGVFGHPDGSFGVYVSKNDSIVLSVKRYDRLGFRVKPDSTCQMLADFVIVARATELDPVVVKPIKSIQQIKEEREALAMRETRTITGIEAVQSPITALYQRFSREEKSKAKVAELEYKDNKIEIVRELLSLYVLYDVIQLTDEEMEDFITFMSMDENFLKTASDIELARFVKEKYEHYTLIHPR